MGLPVYRPNPQRKGPEVMMGGALVLAVWVYITLVAVASFGVLGGISTFLGPIAALLLARNRKLVTAYRNGHTSFTTVTVEVTANERTHHIMENYDRELLDVKDDVVEFLNHAGGVTPVASRIWQRDSGSVSAFDDKDRNHAEITIHVGYNKNTLQPEDLKENLKKAVTGDDRVKKFKRLQFGGPVVDSRDSTSLTGDDYEKLGAAVEERTGLTKEEKQRLEEAEELLREKDD